MQFIWRNFEHEEFNTLKNIFCNRIWLFNLIFQHSYSFYPSQMKKYKILALSFMNMLLEVLASIKNRVRCIFIKIITILKQLLCFRILYVLELFFFFNLQNARLCVFFSTLVCHSFKAYTKIIFFRSNMSNIDSE